MPLSPPVARAHQYARAIECHGYLRSDGLWDIEGRLHDVRDYASTLPSSRQVPAGVPVHSMAMRLTIDSDLTIRRIEIAMDSTPYDECPGVVANFERLVGVSLKGGFAKSVRDLFGRSEGCTHLREMLAPMATAAFQTVFNYRRHHENVDEAAAKKALLNSCYSLASGSPVVKWRWPDAYTGK